MLTAVRHFGDIYTVLVRMCVRVWVCVCVCVRENAVCSVCGASSAAAAVVSEVCVYRAASPVFSFRTVSAAVCVRVLVGNDFVFVCPRHVYALSGASAHRWGPPPDAIGPRIRHRRACAERFALPPLPPSRLSDPSSMCRCVRVCVCGFK